MNPWSKFCLKSINLLMFNFFFTEKKKQSPLGAVSSFPRFVNSMSCDTNCEVGDIVSSNHEMSKDDSTTTTDYLILSI